MNKDSTKPENDSSRREVQVLNYTNGETIHYPFVLLECNINVSELSSVNKLTDISAANGHEAKSVVFDNGSVLVETGSECRSWPVIHGGFKALVQLNTGTNVIKFKICINRKYLVQDFNLIYIPSTLKRFVRVVYIKCSDADGSFQAPPGVINDVNMATKKLAFNARLLQTFTAQDMYKHGFGHKTFRLDEDTTGHPLISVFTSSLTTAEALKMTGGQLYDKFSSELSKSSLHSPLCKFWAFMSCTRYDPPSTEEFDDKIFSSYVKAHTALGGGQLALFGTGNLHTWASEVDELVSCFTNTMVIDRRTLFDDSAKRGSYWANYATGLGASMHELGHCFDLAHTPGGIMGRGFDDFNCVFSLWKKPPPSTCQESDVNVTEHSKAITTNKGPSTSVKMDIPQQLIDSRPHLSVQGLVEPSHQESLQPTDERLISRDDKLGDWISDKANLTSPGDWSHGAKWFRSSAVILCHHKWFNDGDDVNKEPSNQPIVHWSSSFYGPVGNMSDSYNCTKTSFNDITWLADNDAVLCGYVIHADEYVNSIQTIARIVKVVDNVEETQEIFSEPQGHMVGHKYVFKIDTPDEHVTAIDVRAGAWIDAIRIHTNYKSSVLMGGEGGCLNHFQPSEGQRIVGMFGRAGDFLGSLGIFLESSSDAVPAIDTDKDLIIVAPNGLRLIELHDKKHGEVFKHWEFLDSPPPTRFTLDRDEIIEQQARIVVIDDKGNMHSSGPFCDLDKIFAPSTEVKKELETQSQMSSLEDEERPEDGVELSDDVKKEISRSETLEGNKEKETACESKTEETQDEEETKQERNNLEKSGEEKATKSDLTTDDILTQHEEETKQEETERALTKVTQNIEVLQEERGHLENDCEEEGTMGEKETEVQNELAKTAGGSHRTKRKQSHPASQCKDKGSVTRYY